MADDQSYPAGPPVLNAEPVDMVCNRGVVKILLTAIGEKRETPKARANALIALMGVVGTMRRDEGLSVLCRVVAAVAASPIPPIV